MRALSSALLGAVAASLAFAVACSSTSETEPGAADPFPLDSASGLRIKELGPVPPLADWADNPSSNAKKELGRLLFNDARLSGSGRQACQGCHVSTNDFQSSLPLDLPDRSYPNLSPTLPRHTPSLLNLVYAPIMRWDGSHFTDLYDMGVFPFAEANMNVAHELPAEKVDEVDLPEARVALKKKFTQELPGYVAVFRDAFGEDITEKTPEEVWRLAGKAMAVYLRVAVSRDSAFDRWNAGDAAAIGADAKRGVALFVGKAKCSICHSGPLFSDFDFHNVSTSLPGADGTRPDEGRFRVTGREADRGAFLTPTLRSSALTGPYRHDGSGASVAAVIRGKIGRTAARDPNREALLDSIPDLSDAEIADLVAFVKTLSGKPLALEDVAPPATLP